MKNVFTIVWGFLHCQNVEEILQFQNALFNQKLQYT